MRSLKECYEIAKKYHVYWAEYRIGSSFMCIAADDAFADAALTEPELHAVKKDAMSLVYSLDPSAMFLIQALGNVSYREVKAFWDKYIDNLENQDGRNKVT